MTYDELRRALRAKGVGLVRPGGRHDWFGFPGSHRRAAIPRHEGEVPNGTLHRILRDLGLTLDDLRRP